MNAKTAILVDGGFFIKRYKSLKKHTTYHPEEVAKDLWEMCVNHLKQRDGVTHELYRIFYYDCPPFSKKLHNPITKKSVDFSKTEEYQFKMNFLEALKKKRKVAIRLGKLESQRQWILKPQKTKDLFNGKIQIKDLNEKDVFYDLRQKQVDIKIGLDIASMSLKKQVNQIVLVSADSDFIPAAKLARREGIDFILDNMYNPIKPMLFEHIDGLQSRVKKPGKL